MSTTTITVVRSVAIREGLDIDQMKRFYAKRNIVIDVIEDIDPASGNGFQLRTCEKCQRRLPLDGKSWTRRERADGQLSTWRKYCADCMTALNDLTKSKRERRLSRPIYKNIKATPPTHKPCRICRETLPLGSFPVSEKGRILWVCTTCREASESASERTCTRCATTRPINQFDVSASSVGGRRWICRPCSRP